MRSLSEVRQIEIIASGDCDGEWDQARLGQVFSNLIGNAIQYSPDDSKITVKIIGKDDQVTISVHNDGEPISSDDQKSIFKSMTRGTAGANSMRSANLGLGLFITHKIVTAHDGTISVHSASGAGTTFNVILPRHAGDSWQTR